MITLNPDRDGDTMTITAASENGLDVPEETLEMDEMELLDEDLDLLDAPELGGID